MKSFDLGESYAKTQNISIFFAEEQKQVSYSEWQNIALN